MGYLGNQITTVFPTSISVDTATISGNTTVGGTLGVTGATTLSNTLGVTGVSTLSDNIVFDASSKGVHLGVTSATASNLLDDYEEGTWTPGVGGNATYTDQTGTYTKVGRLVYVTCNMQINVIGTGSVTTITTLPFSGSGGLENSSAVGYWTTLSRNVTSLMACLNSNQVVFTDTASAVSGTTLNGGIFQNGTNVRFSLCYQV